MKVIKHSSITFMLLNIFFLVKMTKNYIELILLYQIYNDLGVYCTQFSKHCTRILNFSLLLQKIGATMQYWISHFYLSTLKYQKWCKNEMWSLVNCYRNKYIASTNLFNTFNWAILLHLVHRFMYSKQHLSII